MNKECIVCGKILSTGLFSTPDFFQLSGGDCVCKTCAQEVGWTSGLKSTMQAARYNYKSFCDLYHSCHPEVDAAPLAARIKNEKLTRTINENNLKLEKMSVKHPTIPLASDEKCLYEGNAETVHTKNVVVGRNSVHLGSGKGGLYSSIGQSNNVRGDVQERYNGRLYITTKRFVMVAAKYGFDIPVNQIGALSLYSDGLMVTQGNKSYMVASKELFKIRTVIETSNKLETAKSELNEPSNNASAKTQDCAASFGVAGEKNAVDAIREYKKLLDDGIISQEEFELKKRKLLGIG